MAWSDLSDLANTACRSVFGQTAIVGGTTIAAVYSNEAVTLQPPGAPPVISSQPRLDYRTADLVTQPTAGTTVTVSSLSYTVLSVHPDGQGWTMLQLRRAT